MTEHRRSEDPEVVAARLERALRDQRIASRIAVAAILVFLAAALPALAGSAPVFHEWRLAAYGVLEDGSGLP
jgi:hypothetical protein